MEATPSIDSQMNFEEAIAGLEIPKEIQANLVLVNVPYVGFDERLHQGQLVVHQAVANEVREIFKAISETRFPIKKVVPIVAYGWNDERSMQDNNSSAFNYRLIRGTDIPSNHSYGLAIDINPFLNPCVGRDGISTPIGGIYDPSRAGTLMLDSAPVKIFMSYGWDWGGTWERKDWQHFAKEIPV
jgi:peptidoglycan L-alanyl-D-glutamate endopeptidase CwlK